MNYYLIYRDTDNKFVKVEQFTSRDDAMALLKKEETSWAGGIIFSAAKDLPSLVRVYVEYFL